MYCGLAVKLIKLATFDICRYDVHPKSISSIAANRLK